MNTAQLNEFSEIQDCGAEKTLFEEFDSGWDKYLPVTLITYGDGTMDLHTQTGPDFEKRITRAKSVLGELGLTVGKTETLGPSGAYLPVYPASSR